MNPLVNQSSVSVSQAISRPGNNIATKNPSIEKPVNTPEVSTREVLPDRQTQAADGTLRSEVLQQAEGKQPSEAEKSLSSEAELNQAVAEINQFVQQIQRDLQFSVDDKTGRNVIKVIDSESKEVIRQIPEEKLLDVARSLRETLEGSLLEVKA